jgi:hypothetical protein
VRRDVSWIYFHVVMNPKLSHKRMKAIIVLVPFKDAIDSEVETKNQRFKMVSEYGSQLFKVLLKNPRINALCGLSLQFQKSLTGSVFLRLFDNAATIAVVSWL